MQKRKHTEKRTIEVRAKTVRTKRKKTSISLVADPVAEIVWDRGEG
jgi:hypothetical protein